MSHIQIGYVYDHFNLIILECKKQMRVGLISAHHCKYSDCSVQFVLFHQINLSLVGFHGRSIFKTLRCYMSLNHLAQAARAVLQNPSQISQMLADLNGVDFANVQVCAMSSSSSFAAFLITFLYAGAGIMGV